PRPPSDVGAQEELRTRWLQGRARRGDDVQLRRVAEQRCRHRQQHHRREHTQADQPATLASELTPHRRGRRPPPLPHRRGHDSRTLGSNTRYNSSASRFITNTEDANTTNTPCSSGRSGPRNASYVNNPSPGHENTVSTVTVP